MNTNYAIAINGKTYAGTSESIARQLVGNDAHGMLIEDTKREIEYHGEIVPDAPKRAEHTIEKQEWEDACQHDGCYIYHRHLLNTELQRDNKHAMAMKSYDMQGVERITFEKRYHSIVRTQWSIVDADGYSVEVFDTRREAKAALARMTRLAA